jgi:hypothetical protein
MKGNALGYGETIAKNKTKNLLYNQQVNFNQTWYKSFLGKGNSTLLKIKDQIHFKG